MGGRVTPPRLTPPRPIAPGHEQSAGDRLFGIRILMFYNDHAPPHFHAEYGVSLLGPDEAAELWPFLDETHPGFRHYRTRSEREIPIVQLVPEPQ